MNMTKLDTTTHRGTQRARAVRRSALTDWRSGLTVLAMACFVTSCTKTIPAPESQRVKSTTPTRKFACKDVLRQFSMVGSPKEFGHRDGSFSDALFSSPTGLVADQAGSIFVADEGNHDVREIKANGAVTTLSGQGDIGYRDGKKAEAQFGGPVALARAADGAIYVVDWLNESVRKITRDGAVATIAGGHRGTPYIGANGKQFDQAQTGWKDGQGTEALFNNPRGIAVDDRGSVYVADASSNTIRKISTDGTVKTIAGRAPGGNLATGFVDGDSSQARTNYPAAMTADQSGNVYFADNNHAVRRISRDGVVSTLAGGGSRRFVANPLFPDLNDVVPQGKHRDGTGVDASFSRIDGLSIDSGGSILIAERFPSAIRVVAPDGIVTTILEPSPGCEIGQFLDSRKVGDDLRAAIWLPDGRIAFAIGSVVMIEK